MGNKLNWWQADPYPFQYVWCKNEKDYIKAQKRIGVKKLQKWPKRITGAKCEVFKSKEYVTTFLILYPTNNLDFLQEMAIIAHEVMHIVQFIWEEIREEKPSPEAEAYLFQRTFQNLIYDIFPNAKRK